MNMQKKLSISILLLWLLLPAISTHSLHAATTYQSVDDEFEQLMQKIREDFSRNPNIDKLLKTPQQADGSFADIDYASIQRTNWPPIQHIERISDFVEAYTHPSNKHYQSDELFEKIQKGLEYWQKRNPWCHNWWYNQIAEPQKLGVLLILLRTGARQIPDSLENAILTRMHTDGGDPAKWTGANRTDIALHWIYRACLQRNEKDLLYALDHTYKPVAYTTKEGFQYDNSNFQHGQQLYIGGYGDEILKGVTQVAMYTHGTRFAMPQDKIDLLSKFMRETYYGVMRGKYMSFDVLGRGMSRPNILNKSYTALFAQRMIKLDPKHANTFKQIVGRLKGELPADAHITPRHTHYFRGDYTLHQRPHYSFDVRLVSNRTMRCEYGNGENLKTYFLSDGCTNITTHGGEYYNIFPVWDWARIPGVTAPQFKEIPKAKVDWQTPGTSTFAGGVSDSLYGVTTYVYKDDYKNINTSARKAWFFFDDEVVCLGSDIRSSAPKAVYTTLNQALGFPESGMFSSNGKVSSLPSVAEDFEQVNWVLHDHIGYFFPQGGKVIVGCQEQKGSWYDINNSVNRKEEEKETVFTLSLNHGTHPQGKSYGYIVLPGKETAAEMKKYQKKCPIEILQNDASLQIVRHKKLNIYQFVFHEAGCFENKDICIKADKPCAMILKGIDGKQGQLHVADPGQGKDNIHISVVTKKRKGKEYTFLFQPSDNPIYRGATQAFHIPF